MKRMLDSIGFNAAAQRWEWPQPGSNRGYQPVQLIEQLFVSIWCGANRFAHTEITRFDATLIALFGWARAAGQRAIVRLFERCDMARNERLQVQMFGWFFDRLHYARLTLDLDSTVITRWGERQEGAARGYNSKRMGRASYHPLIAFVSDCRMVANFWLHPGNASSSNNALAFIRTTFTHLGGKTVGLLRADLGFYDDAILRELEGRSMDYIVSVHLT